MLAALDCPRLVRALRPQSAAKSLGRAVLEQRTTRRSSLPSRTARPSIAMPREAWCPLSPSISDGLSCTVFFATLGQLACSLGGMLASELGILSSLPLAPITNLKPVPWGTRRRHTGARRLLFGAFPTMAIRQALVAVRVSLVHAVSHAVNSNNQGFYNLTTMLLNRRHGRCLVFAGPGRCASCCAVIVVWGVL
ncbi:hypothetical protein CONPUDRAFT_169340 [Coniophora puteana RWD-64-598 SS2]|uniref:Uncharacterized protein n=1 Tax=Coniophora puteana (strain RWD-64-598) TaxID=741705 RepID=A0A5M3MA40_CONPW|nr:uncharacterized protein CONPUDRAFT_169340 [Coniophora puteana RWD-64-598 SS2]EIW75505.1 hypothetical protein CONPUDRAFT_169340 [Coniophora puteana RWD-64-598 SS2]